MKLNLIELVDEILIALPSRSRDIISMRYALKNSTKEMNFSEIAKKLGITRERVRQIHAQSLTKLNHNLKIEGTKNVLRDIEDMFKKINHVFTEEAFNEFIEVKTLKEKRYVKFLLHLVDSVELNKAEDYFSRFWHHKSFDVKLFKKAIKDFNKSMETKKDKLYSISDIHKEIDKSLLKNSIKNKNLQKIVLELSKNVDSNFLEEWGHISNVEIGLNKIEGYIKIFLRKTGEAKHFNDILKGVVKIKGKKVSTGSCHNELVYNDDFVLCGKGLYGLKSHGYEHGTVSDIIEGILKKKSMPREAIVKHVLQKKHVKKSTVIQSLSNNDKFFFEKKKNIYSLQK